MLELIVGHDGAVRSVKLKRGDGKVVHHSISHLYPLELSLTHTYKDAPARSQGEMTQNLEETEAPQEELVSGGVDMVVPVGDQGSSSQHLEEIEDPQFETVSDGDDQVDTNAGNEQRVSDENSEVCGPNVRQKRRAATACRQKVRKWCAELNL